MSENGAAAGGVARDSDSRQRILYVGGLGRSGSTLLAVLLNSLRGFASVGELRYVWLYQHQNLLCACGEPFQACEFWSAVGQSAFGGWDRVDIEQIMANLRLVDRQRYMPLLVKPQLSRGFADRLRVYQDAISRIYAGIRAASGCDVVVDSTKEPPFAYVVRGIESLDLRVVHLVRDSRGVAYSWMKWKRRPEVRDREAFMDRYGPASTSLRWLDCNLLMHNLVGPEIPGLLVRYEDFIARPRTLLTEIVRHAGEPVDAATIDDLLEGRSAPAQNHAVAGNPIRFERGPLKLRLDDEWRSQMRPADRKLVTLLTAPLLWRYGYSDGLRSEAVAAGAPHASGQEQRTT